MRARRCAGMSLAELLVAVSLSAVVLLAGTWILMLLLRQAAEQVGRPPALGGPAELALEQIERDAQLALEAPARKDGWEAAAGTLILVQPGERVIIYQRDGERLLRTVQPGPGEPERVRVLADEVVGADFVLAGSLFHLRLRRAAGGSHYRVVLGRNLGRVPPDDEGEEG